MVLVALLRMVQCMWGIQDDAQSEEFFGKIIGAYPSIFIIELDNKIIKSFSYSDLLINNLEIIEC